MSPREYAARTMPTDLLSNALRLHALNGAARALRGPQVEYECRWMRVIRDLAAPNGRTPFSALAARIRISSLSDCKVLECRFYFDSFGLGHLHAAQLRHKRTLKGTREFFEFLKPTNERQLRKARSFSRVSHNYEYSTSTSIRRVHGALRTYLQHDDVLPHEKCARVGDERSGGGHRERRRADWAAGERVEHGVHVHSEIERRVVVHRDDRRTHRNRDLALRVQRGALWTREASTNV